MEKNFRMVNEISPRPLEFSVVNAGNIREFLLELSANARMMWDFHRYRSDTSLEEFCRAYFGDEKAPDIAALYRRFYDSYWTPKKPDLPGFDRQYIFQDQRYARAIEQLLPQLTKGRNLDPLNERTRDAVGRYFRIVPEDSGAKTQIDAILSGTAASIERLTGVVRDADRQLPSIPEPGRVFFNDNLRVQAYFLLHLNHVLRSVAQAMGVLPDKGRAIASLRAARQSAAAMQGALREAEHDRFTGWYDGDRVFGLDRMKTRIERAISELGGDDR
jgi:Glycosyl hydrolase family 115